MNLKNRNIKRILVLTCLLVILSLNAFMINTNINQYSNNITNDSSTSIDQEKTKNPYTSELDNYQKEVIRNGNFSQGTRYWTNTTGGDVNNLNASISKSSSNNYTNYEILGNKTTKKVDTSLNSGGWYIHKNGIFILPDTSVVNKSGCYVKHIWNEGVNQTRNYPSVLWKKTVSLPVDMSHYNISSASLQVKINGSADYTVDVQGDTIAISGGSTTDFRKAIYDFAEFFVEISDFQGTSTYRVAYNRTSTLGKGNPPGTSNMATKTLEGVGTQKDLITAISRTLENDPVHKKFNITLGITIYCEDNDRGNDVDIWRYLIINSCNLTFTYERFIDKDSSLSWNNKGYGIFETGKPITIINATLNFKHYINYNWLSNTSSTNSEIRIILNNYYQLPETVKLTNLTNKWQKAKSNGFVVTPFVEKNKYINISIQVYIGDTFDYDKKIIVSIDNVSLLIWYSVSTEPYETKYDLFLDQQNRTLSRDIEASIGETVNITFIYKNDTTNNKFIPGATVTLKGAGIDTTLDEYAYQYNTMIDTDDLGFGDKYLTLKASNRYYETQEFTIKISVVQRYAYIDKVYLNRTLATTIDEVPSGFLLNITIKYMDNITKNMVSNATVELLNTTQVLGKFNETTKFNQYNYSLNTTGFPQGVYYFTIHAEAGVNYTSDYQQIIVIVLAKGTSYDLYLNRTERDTIGVTIYQFVYINFTFKDLGGNPILSAAVDINGSGISRILKDYGDGNYSTSINTTILNQGNNRLDIFAQINGYISQSATLWIRMDQRQTNLSLYINRTYYPIPSDFVIIAPDLTIGDRYNITVSYIDELAKTHIGGAQVSLNGTLFSLLLKPIVNNYSEMLESTDLNWGTNYLSIIAEKELYEPQTITVKITVISIKTNYRFYLNTVNKTNILDQSIKIMWNELLNITVRFLDKNGNHVPLATVDINGTGISKILKDYGQQQYNITINTAIFSVGFTYCTIVAYKNNYQAQTIAFKIEVIDRPTNYQVILNGVNSTTVPSIDLPIGELLEIKIKFIDNTTKNHINGATINVTGEGILESLNESATLKEYSITISSSDLDIGVRYLTVFAQRSNYVSQSITLTVEVKRIRTEITTVSGNTTINIRPGENANVSIILKNLDFGGRIKGARVNYTWELGQGALYDLDNDGVYQITLENVPAGTYTLTITVYTSDDYEFERFRITINAVRPEQEVFWTYIIAGTGIAAAIASGSYLIAYQKVLKYPKSIRKLRKFRSKLKRKTITGIEINSRDSTITSLYQSELGKISKLFKGKQEEKSKEEEKPQEMPDKVIDKLSEKTTEVKSDKSPDNPPNPI